MNFSIEIVISVIGLILTAFGTVLIIYFKDMKNNLNNIASSVETLNIKIAILLEKDEVKDKRLDGQALKLANLEKSIMEIKLQRV